MNRFLDAYDDPIVVEPSADTEGYVLLTVRDSLRGEGVTARAELSPLTALGIASALTSVAGVAPAPIPDDAVEFVLHLRNGEHFYTGGFDDAMAIWKLVNRAGGDGIAGTFDREAEHEDRWIEVSFDVGAVLAIEDLRA